MSRKSKHFHGDCPSCGQNGPLQTRLSILANRHTKAGEDINLGNAWSGNTISQAQRKGPDNYWASTGAVPEGTEEAIYAWITVLEQHFKSSVGSVLTYGGCGMRCFVFVLRRMVHHRNSVVLPASLIQPALKKCLTLRQEVILGVRKLFIK